MSVINQMLRDLESGRSSTSEVRGLPGNVRIIEESSYGRSPRLRYALVLIAILPAAACGWLYLRQHSGDDLVLSRREVAPTHPESAGSAAATATLTRTPASMPTPRPTPVAVAASPPFRVISTQTSEDRPSAVSLPAPASISPAPNEQVQGPRLGRQGAATRKPVSPKPLSQRAVAGAAKGPIRQPDQSQRSYRSDSPDETAEEILRKGARLYASGQVARAQDQLERCLRLDPENFRARLLLAKSYIAAGDLEQAESLLAGGEADGEIAKLRAQLLLKRGQTGQAETVLERSLAAAGNDPGVLGVLGALRQRQGRHVDAIAAYQQATREEPTQPKWWLGLAISLDALERYQDALAAYQRAMSTGVPSYEVRSYVENRIAALRGNR